MVWKAQALLVHKSSDSFTILLSNWIPLIFFPLRFWKSLNHLSDLLLLCGCFCFLLVEALRKYVLQLFLAFVLFSSFVSIYFWNSVQIFTENRKINRMTHMFLFNIGSHPFSFSMAKWEQIFHDSFHHFLLSFILVGSLVTHCLFFGLCKIIK